MSDNHIRGQGFEDKPFHLTQEEMIANAKLLEHKRLEDMLADLGFVDSTDYYMPAWVVNMCQRLLDAGWIKE